MGMRQVYLVFFAGLIIIAGLIVASWRPFKSSSQTGSILLTNLPSTYCPIEAEIFHSSNQRSASLVKVTNCNQILLDQLSLAQAEDIYLKLPKAVAVKIIYRSENQQYQVGLQLGDVNADNRIDEIDERLVVEQIFGVGISNDVDRDGKITANDLAIVRTNRAVGAERPDAREWRL